MITVIPVYRAATNLREKKGGISSGIVSGDDTRG
jgi:hypothetical protein